MRVYDILNEMISQINNLQTKLNKIDFSKGASSGIIDFIYPVGSFYISSNSTNPTLLFGGTWEQIKGAFLYGVNTEVIENAARLTDIIPDGGLSEYKLTSDNIPAHTHGETGGHDHPANGYHAHNIGYRFDGDWCGKGTRSAVNGHTSGTIGTSNDGTHSHPGGGTHEHNSFGKSDPDAINNMPPYLKVYIWKRTI